MVGSGDFKSLEDITLSVYWYVVKAGKPVGPREVTKGAHLSSPSVAYRHLQKLEDTDLLEKNEYGDYIVKRKVNMRGYIWVGRRLLPKMLLYTIIFTAILIVEIIVLAMHYAVEDYQFKVFFLLLMLVTVFAMALFTIEGFMHIRRTNKTLNATQTAKT
ncbi:MAG: hypothetical protein NWF04_05025 [Candidatus Bathyarchaeota archaeon]|nr:hypothetical protein [Candidatus Bathyarchaeota archaeon]